MDIFALIPQFGGLIYTILAFVIALSIIVAVHEYGHYIVGRWSGIHAEVFSLGFGPVLYSRMDKRGTRWQIAALPFGGYVKFLGDANAASGKDEDVMASASEDPAAMRRTMHGAPLWARAATVVAGPVFNFVLSIIVFAAIFMMRGVIADPLTVGELRDLPGGTYELQAGDEIVAINGLLTPSIGDNAAWNAFSDDIPVTDVLEYSVRRSGQEQVVEGPYLYPPYVAQVIPRSAAMDIDLKKGDVITAVNDSPIVAFSQLKEAVESSDGQPLQLDVWRDGQNMDFELTPRRTDEPQADGGFVTYWRIGIASGRAFEPATVATGPVDAFKGGVSQTMLIINGSLSGLWHMITGAISSCNISGPIGIAKTSGAVASQGAQSFIAFVAMLSTAVGLLNLFPIPALDGGHLMFYAYEAVTGKPPSDKALRFLMTIGLVLILSLMVFALGNDLFC